MTHKIPPTIPLQKASAYAELFSRADQHVGNGWGSGIDTIPSLPTLTHTAAPNSAVDLAYSNKSRLPELTLPSVPQQPGSLFNPFNQRCPYGDPECQKLFSQSQGAAVRCCNPDKRASEAFHASASSKILRAMKLSAQKCRDSSCTRRHMGFFQSSQNNKQHHIILEDLPPGNVFVVSLAVADLIVAIYPYPLVLTSVFHNGWKLGYLHCQISGFLMGLSVIGSIFNITGIAINRYCYICHSLKYDKLYSDRNSLCYIVLIWVLTFVAIVPNLFVGSLQYDPRIYSCTFAQSVSSAYTIAVVFFHFLLPIAVVTFCYLRIWILVIQVRRRVKPDNNPRLKPHDFRNFVTMFVVFVLFAVCWAPLNFIGIAVAVNPKTVIPRIPEWLFVSSYYMAYFNSCLNAIVYGLLNQNFRREYKRIIVTFCTAKVFFQDSSNDAGDRMRSKPSPLITNNNQVKVDSV
ncbi:melatonin receptor type 1A [Geospiza fortis]|uniref:Melatonin receptor type 1A n=3 Tax=Passeriformes TaxID=9126 RepID=A0A8N5I2H6_GEOFO|nr:melatonin receptor type 1A [Geospiza fortis]